MLKTGMHVFKCNYFVLNEMQHVKDLVSQRGVAQYTSICRVNRDKALTNSDNNTKNVLNTNNELALQCR